MDGQGLMPGGCLCGAVRYALHGAIGGPSGAVTVCHCSQCRKAQGGPAAVGPARADQFEITAGQSLIREYESSPGKFRAFCERCGSPLYSRLARRPGVIRVRLGSLDDAPAELRIEAHIFFEDRVPWEDSPDAATYAAREPER